MHLARRCGLGLYHIELLAVSAELLLADSQAVAAEQAAREALEHGFEPGVSISMGGCGKRAIAGEVLLAQDRLTEGMAAIKEARSLWM